MSTPDVPPTDAGPGGSALAGRRRVISALPALAVVALATWLASRNGGYDGGDWNGVSLVVIALLGTSLLAFGPANSRALRRILVVYAAFCAWGYLSIVWSAVPDSAWQAANRATLYGLVLALIANRDWRRREAAGAIALVVLCIAGLSALTLIRSANAPGVFIGGRLVAPTGYQNAAAQLWLIGLWPALALACVVPLRAVGRPLWLALATLLAQTSLLSQSRGAVVTIAVIAASFVLFSRSRARAITGLLTVAGACALAWNPLTGPRSAHTSPQLASAFSHARLAIALSCVGVAVLVIATDALAGPAAAILGRARRPWPAGRLSGRRDYAAAAAATLLVFVAFAGNPVTWTQARWRDFKNTGYSRLESSHTRFTGGLGSNRYDFYRVAIDEWLAHPVNGIGGDNFRLPYLAQRRSPEAPRYPHSLPLAVLSQLGLVGALLFAAFLGLVVRSLAGPVRRGPPVALGACLGFASWMVHASLDWLWEFPGLGMLAFALLAIALRSSLDGDGEAASRPRLRAVVVAAAALACAPLIASFATQLLTARANAAGQREAAAHPAAAMADFERAATLDRAQSDSLVGKAIVATRIGRPAIAADALRRAIGRVPDDWFAHFELGVLDAGARDRAGALLELRRARRLNPRQATIGAAAALVVAGRGLSPAAIDRALTAPLNRRLTQTGR